MWMEDSSRRVTDSGGVGLKLRSGSWLHLREIRVLSIASNIIHLLAVPMEGMNSRIHRFNS